ncbi:MAG: S8 family serine peptidase [Solirubrobacterales bacterium]
MGRQRQIGIGGTRGRLVGGVVALLVLTAFTGVALGARASFPGTDTDESVRVNTPDDPNFDSSESDDEDGGGTSDVFGQQLERFGFAPGATDTTATYATCPLGPALCTNEHIKRLEEQNVKAGRNAAGQLSGVSVDRAWKEFGRLADEKGRDAKVGNADVEVAILDTGIRWKEESLRTKVALNDGELPEPRKADGSACGADDCNGDGAFNVDDYADDGRVSKASGSDDEPAADDLLDASDLIAVFSDGSDADGNGYADDIAGWDFFDDDNNPFDASSYSSASNHGTGRAQEAGEQTNDAKGGTGMCPECQVVPLRVWDTFIVNTDTFALATIYAADNDIEVVEGAVGGLFNSSFARRAFRYAYAKGTIPVIVSSDLNTADHNWPTTYDESLMVQGTVADTHGLGEDAPDGLAQILAAAGVGTNAPVQTWFRNSGTTQYGAHAHLVMLAPTGSQATGQASGAAALLASYARQAGTELAPNEIKQLLTQTAEDVLPENTADGTSGTADPAHPGWDQHFGYGRPDLGLAVERIRQDKVPPQALITSPEWFAPLNVEQESSVQITGRLSGRGGVGRWELQWAPGIEPTEDEFHKVASGSGEQDGALGTVDLNQVRSALDSRTTTCPREPDEATATGGSTCDPTAPRKGPGDADENEPAFTVRLKVTDADGDTGEDRKQLFAYRDTTQHEGWPRKIGSGGESSQRLYDLDGDNALDVVESTSDGTLSVLKADGSPLESFNDGKPLRTKDVTNAHDGAPGVKELGAPAEVLRTPVIGDIDGDRLPEIAATAGEHIYAFNDDGSTVKGFPVRVDPALSKVSDRTRDNHIKRGFIAGPTLGDVDGNGRLDIIAPALDQHAYVVDGKGKALPGFPAKLKDPSEDLIGAESINSASFGDIDGDDKPEIVVATNEVAPASSPGTPGGPFSLVGGLRGLATNFLANAIGGSGRVYALDGTGKIKSGWPVKPNGALPDALPLVGPGVENAIGDLDGDGKLDVLANVASGDLKAYGGDGAELTTYDPSPTSGENVQDKSKILNLFENPIVADLDGEEGLEVFKGGLTTNGLVNLGVAVGQNLPYYHLLQGWDGRTGNALPSFPQAVNDYQLLSTPAVADVSDSSGDELALGTGLYYLRAINASGEEGTGWPKFTGGWLFAVPAIGDVDGDNKLEVTALTREGTSFVWDTDRPACGGNDQWWTHRHDEFSSGNHETDSRPPGAATRVQVDRSGSDKADAEQLQWRAPGDDLLCGTARRYEIRYSDEPITSPSDGTSAGRFDVADSSRQARASAGENVKQPLTGRARKAEHFAVLYQDEAGNWGPVAQATVTAVASPTEADDSGDDDGSNRDKDGSAGAANATAAGDGGDNGLAFTGWALIPLALVGLALLAGGEVLRRRWARHRAPGQV